MSQAAQSVVVRLRGDVDIAEVDDHVLFVRRNDVLSFGGAALALLNDGLLEELHRGAQVDPFAPLTDEHGKRRMAIINALLRGRLARRFADTGQVSLYDMLPDSLRSEVEAADPSAEELTQFLSFARYRVEWRGAPERVEALREALASTAPWVEQSEAGQRVAPGRARRVVLHSSPASHAEHSADGDADTTHIHVSCDQKLLLLSVLGTESCRTCLALTHAQRDVPGELDALQRAFVIRAIVQALVRGRRAEELNLGLDSQGEAKALPLLGEDNCTACANGLSPLEWKHADADMASVPGMKDDGETIARLQNDINGRFVDFGEFDLRQAPWHLSMAKTSTGAEVVWHGETRPQARRHTAIEAARNVLKSRLPGLCIAAADTQKQAAWLAWLVRQSEHGAAASDWVDMQLDAVQADYSLFFLALRGVEVAMQRREPRPGLITVRLRLPNGSYCLRSSTTDDETLMSNVLRDGAALHQAFPEAVGLCCIQGHAGPPAPDTNWPSDALERGRFHRIDTPESRAFPGLHFTAYEPS